MFQDPNASGGFLDFARSWIPGGNNAIPSWLAGLLVKKPQASMDVSSALPYYQALAEAGSRSMDAADRESAFREQYFRPAAVEFASKAAREGSEQARAEAADRNAADFRLAYGAQKSAVDRTMRGVNPNSGAAMALQGKLRASYAPGVVDAMNKGRATQAKVGMDAQKTALAALDTTPNYSAPASIMSAAGRGAVGLSRLADDQYRRKVADTTKTLKLPFDYADETRRAADAAKSMDSVLQGMRTWLGGRGTDFDGSTFTMPEFQQAASTMWDVDGGV